MVSTEKERVMKTRLLMIVALAVAAGMAMAQEPGRAAELSAHVQVMRGKGAQERPEETSSFALDDAVVCAFWVKNYRADAAGRPGGRHPVPRRTETGRRSRWCSCPCSCRS